MYTRLTGQGRMTKHRDAPASPASSCQAKSTRLRRRSRPSYGQRCAVPCAEQRAAPASQHQFCRFLTVARSPFCVAVKIRCRSGIRRFTRVHPSGLPLARRRAERERFGFHTGLRTLRLSHDARQGGDDPPGHWTEHVATNCPPIGVTTHHVGHHVARLPPSSPPLRRQSGEGFPPPLGQSAPRGAPQLS